MPPNGSSMWVWASTPPGMTYLPVASMMRSARPAPAARSSRARRARRPARLDEDVGVRLSGGGDDRPPLMRVRSWSLPCSVVGSPRARRRSGARSSRSALREDRRRPSSASSAVSGERRRDAQHVAVEAALADEQARVASCLQHGAAPLGRRAAERPVPGLTSSMPSIRPRPRTSPHAGGRRRAQAVEQDRRSPAALAWRSCVEQVPQVGEPPAAVTGVPPNVEMELARRQFMISARATTPPRDMPLPMPLAKVSMSGARRSRAPASPRSGRRCGPSRSAPRRQIKRMPCPSSTFVEGAEKPVGRGGEPADALDRLGDQRRDVAARLVEHLAQVVHARLDVLVVGQLGERAAHAVAAVHVVALERRRATSATTPGCR